MWTVAHREALCNLCAVTLLVGEKSAEETRKSHVILVADDVARGFQCVPARHVCSAPSGTFATDGSSSVRSSERVAVERIGTAEEDGGRTAVDVQEAWAVHTRWVGALVVRV